MAPFKNLLSPRSKFEWTDGWEIALAGSRFLKPSETHYTPVEGEALAIAWSLKQTRHFTQGCDELLVVTDHSCSLIEHWMKSPILDYSN